MDNLEHPVVSRILRFGYPEEERCPECPVCGRECSQFYYVNGDLVGCDECVVIVDAWEVMEGGEIDV